MAHIITDECVACGACADTCPVGAIALGDNGIYVEGVLKILDISEKQILLKVKNYKIKITGEKLKIYSYFEGDVSIKGSFSTIVKERDEKWLKTYFI